MLPMYLLRFYERDEIFQMAVSSDIDSLKHHAADEYGKKLRFKKDRSGYIHIYPRGENISIGIIGPVPHVY